MLLCLSLASYPHFTDEEPQVERDNFLCHKVLQEVELGLELRSKDKAHVLYMIPEQKVFTIFFYIPGATGT